MREWFEWSNGQAGGLWDDDDHVACVLPLGRQLDLATSEQLAAAMPAQHLTEVLQPCYVIQEYWTSLLVECAGPNAGSVWLNQSDAPPLELAYESLSDLVRQALRLLDLGWIYLNDTGTPTLRESTALEREGVVFEGDLERYHYWTIGRLPRSVGGP